MDPRRWPEELQRAREEGLLRRLRPPADARVDLASNDYLGLSDHPEVVEAAARAAREHGVGATASRLLGASSPLYTELESRLAALKSSEAALVFSSGYAANVGMLTSLCDEGDVILADRLNHASLIDGARMSRARLHFYRHADPDSLRERLKRLPKGEGHRWIVTDAVFSMDGVLAPLPELRILADEYGATLVVDDAHATGVLGPEGRGSLAHFGVDPEGVVQMGTLSKALGTQGGFVCGSRALVELLVNRARSFIYSTGLALPVVAAASAALDVARHEDARREQLQRWCETLRRGLRSQGWEVIGAAPCPMLGVDLESNEAALNAAGRLEEAGVRVAAVRPPTVPRPRLRLAPKASHREEEIDFVLECFEAQR